MINNNILLSKIVASATEKTWSQVYSTLNLYIVVSLEAETIEEETIASSGKDILERLQREFFALDQKELESIKHAVEEAVKTVPHHAHYSVILATIVEKILYIVVAGPGSVVIKRGKEIGIAAQQQEEHHVSSFSGFLEDHDTIVIGTEAFFKKVPIGHLATSLHEGTVADQAENLAPMIHGNALGTEAAILLSYRHHNAHETDTKQTEPSEEHGHTVEEGGEQEQKSLSEAEKEPEAIEEEGVPQQKRSFIPKISLPIPHVSVSGIRKKRGTIIIGGVAVLLIILALSIVMQHKHAKQAAADAQVSTIIASAQTQYDAAQSLMGLNKSLANNELTQTKTSLQNDRSKFPNGSSQQKQIDDFIAKIDSVLGGTADASAVKNDKVIYDGSGAVKQPGTVTYKGGVLALADASNGTVVTLNIDGTVKDTITTSAKSISALTGDKTNMEFLASDGVYKIDRASKSGLKTIPLSSISGLVGIDTFLGNIYLLNSSDSSIDKYASGGTTKSSYLASGQTLSNTPLSFSIDSSVWVIEKSGALERFTKGKSDGITAKGIPNALGAKLQVYTDIDYTGVYILDSDNGRVVALDKNGAFTTQYTAVFLKGATSLAVDEPDKKIFVTSGGKLYSFDL